MLMGYLRLPVLIEKLIKIVLYINSKVWKKTKHKTMV